jgi:phosphonate transport system ATP-binding protein
MTEKILSIADARKTFVSKSKRTVALNGVSFEVKAGERVALLGASGSGKSTLIRAISGLEILDSKSGAITVCGSQIQANGKINPDMRKIRSSIGVIFQQFNLVNQLDVITNVLIGIGAQKNIFELVLKKFTLEEKALAMDVLENVGMADFAYQRASTLSGGQQQRVAVARALIKGSKILLADEPVASLDPESSRKVMDLIVSVSDQYGLTLITSLHQIHIARRCCDRTIALNKGALVFDGPTNQLDKNALAKLYGSNLGDLQMEDELSSSNNSPERPQLVLVH